MKAQSVAKGREVVRLVTSIALILTRRKKKGKPNCFTSIQESRRQVAAAGARSLDGTDASRCEVHGKDAS